VKQISDDLLVTASEDTSVRVWSLKT